MKSNLVLYFKGGLGNQLFQICAGLSIARKAGMKLEYDDSWYQINERYGSIDRHFRICDLGLVNENMKYLLPSWLSSHRTIRILRRMPLWLRNKLGYFEDLKIDECQMLEKSLSKRKLLNGYWMNPPILNEISSITKALDIHKNRISLKYEELIIELQAKNSISLHIRLGDYKKFANIYDVLTVDYYKDAISAIAFENDLKDNFKIIIFTDDPESAQTQYADIFSDAKWITSKSIPNELDTLVLMSMSSNLVCANSSFSWWAAVSGNRSKKVIFPAKYTSNQFSSEIGLTYPGWIII